MKNPLAVHERLDDIRAELREGYNYHVREWGSTDAEKFAPLYRNMQRLIAVVDSIDDRLAGRVPL